MSKGILLLSVLLMTTGSMSLEAAYFTPDLATIYGMAKTFDADQTTSQLLSVVDLGSSIRFSGLMQYGDASADGWASMGVGYGWPPPSGLQNLSDYDGYTLNFMNTNDDIWLVNLYMNTGWTDPPYEQEDNFYQSDWVELAPGESTAVTLDFAALSVINLDHVTNIGFQVGGNMDAYPLTGSGDPSNPDVYHIDVTIPEPLTLVLLGLGGLFIKRK